jgi:hypothetical protein
MKVSSVTAACGRAWRRAGVPERTGHDEVEAGEDETRLEDDDAAACR